MKRKAASVKIVRVGFSQVGVHLIPPIAKYTPKIYDFPGADGRRAGGDRGVRSLSPRGAGARSVRGGGACLCGEGSSEHESVFRTGVVCVCASGYCRAGLQYSGPPFFWEKVRNRVAVSYWSCPMEPHETAAEAEAGTRLGFANHKLKARSWNIM